MRKSGLRLSLDGEQQSSILACSLSTFDASLYQKFQIRQVVQKVPSINLLPQVIEKE
jgi:hypothetical protein